MHEKYGERVDFRLVYVREAHPIEGGMPPVAADEPIVEDPVTLEERTALARRCTTELGLQAIPLMVDGMDDALALAYEAWPDRLYLIGRDGEVAWRCARGPFGFDPDGLEAAIQAELRKAAAARAVHRLRALAERALRRMSACLAGV